MKLVALGGGHGLSAVLLASRTLSRDITAIVSVADDGGSSGRLVRELGVPPPGDARRCLAALSEKPELADLFHYRFPAGELRGHALGNLVLAALAATTGSMSRALDVAGEMLSVRGRVLPAAAERVRLVAEVKGERVEGQSILSRTEGIQHVTLDPADVAADPQAVKAIGEADLVVMGPGSLYTSVLPALCVPGILDAVRRCRAPRVYVCNLTAQKGETSGMGVAEHLAVLLDHAGDRVVDRMIVNTKSTGGEMLVAPDASEILGVPVLARRLIAGDSFVHAPELLAGALTEALRLGR